MAKTKNIIIQTLPKKKFDVYTAEHFYVMADGYLSETINNTSRVRDSSEMAALYFLRALVLGHKKAAYSLYESFNSGIGVKQDNYMAFLMYGVASMLEDERCITNRVKIPEALDIKININLLIELIQNTEYEIPNSGVDIMRVEDQIDKFSYAIKLPFGTLATYFNITSTQETDSENHIEPTTYEVQAIGTVDTQNQNSEASGCCVIS